MTKRYRIKVRNIVMGVPITFLDKYCTEQFCIIGHEHDLEGTGESEGAVGGQLMVQKKGMYKRILIRKKPKKTKQYRIKVRNIVMGVPITFLDKYCQNQFEIIGLDRYVEDNPNFGHRFNLRKKEVYARVLIRKKPNQ